MNAKTKTKKLVVDIWPDLATEILTVRRHLETIRRQLADHPHNADDDVPCLLCWLQGEADMALSSPLLAVQKAGDLPEKSGAPPTGCGS